MRLGGRKIKREWLGKMRGWCGRVLNKKFAVGGTNIPVAGRALFAGPVPRKDPANKIKRPSSFENGRFR